MSTQPPQYNQNDNNYHIEINSLESNNNEVILTPLTPPPNYQINTRPITENINVLLDLDSEKRKCALYNLSNTLKNISFIFTIYSIFYIIYSFDLLLLFSILFLFSILAYYGIKNYKFFGAFNIYLYLFTDIIIKLLIFLKEDNIFYTILFTLSIIVNIYICYLTNKWCKLINNLNEEELLQMKSGYKSENIYIVWY